MIVTSWIVINFYEGMGAVQVLGGLNLILLFWYIVSWKIAGNEMFSPYIIFLIFTYLFHFGQIILHSFGLSDYIINTRIRANVIEIMPEYVVLKSILFCTISIFFWHSGALTYILKTEKQTKVSITEGSDKGLRYLLKTRIIGLLMLIISLYPMIIFDSSYIKAALSNGYMGIYELDINTGLWDDLARMYKPSVFFLLVSLKNRPMLARYLLVSNVVYSLVKLSIVGQRGYEMIFIVVLIWLYIKTFTKLNIKNILTLSIFSMIACSILSLAVSYRDATERFGFNDIINYLVNKNPVLLSISEFGGTLFTVELYMDLIPQMLKYGLGSSYLYSLLTVFPNVNGILSESVKLASPNYLLSQIVSGIGGSYIGEFYYNFGWFGVLLGLIFGYYFAIFSKITQRAFSENRYTSIAASATFLNIVLWTIRDSFTAIPRNILFQLIIPYILFKLIYKVVLVKKSNFF